MLGTGIPDSANQKAGEQMDAAEVLVNEHSLIRQFVNTLSIAAGKLDTDERSSRKLFEKGKALKNHMNLT